MLPSLEFKDTSRHGEPERHLHRDTPAPASSTFKALSVARSVPPSWGIDDDTLDNDHISYGDLLWDVRDYIDAMDFTANAPANHENANRVSVDPQVQELVDSIRDLTTRDLLTPAAPSPGAASPVEPFPGAVREPCQGEHHRRVERGRRKKQSDFHRTPCHLQQEGGRYAQQQEPSVVTRRAAAELTGAVTLYRGVRSNNNDDDNDNINSNNLAAVTERFQPSTLHKLRKLDLYTNTNTPDLGISLVPRGFLLESSTRGPRCSRAVREGKDRTVSLTPLRRP